MFRRLEGVKYGLSLHFVKIHMSFGKRMNFAAESGGVNLNSCAVVECFEVHKCGEEVVRADNNAVVFKHYRVYTLFKFGRDIVAELAASGQSVGRHCDVATEKTCVRNDRRIGYFSCDAERNECRRMCVKHGSEIGAFLVNCKVERIFHRRAVNTDYRAVRKDLHDILAAEVAFVYTRRADPYNTVRIFD